MSSSCANSNYYCGSSSNNVLRAFLTAGVCLAISAVLTAIFCYVRIIYLRRRRVISLPTLTPATASYTVPDEDVVTISDGGLDRRTVESLPVFVYSPEEEKRECPVCLMEFKNGEKGRVLPKCSHRFHVECIDMWLQFNSTCPCCRASIAGADDQELPD